MEILTMLLKPKYLVPIILGILLIVFFSMSYSRGMKIDNLKLQIEIKDKQIAVLTKNLEVCNKNIENIAQYQKEANNNEKVKKDLQDRINKLQGQKKCPTVSISGLVTIPNTVVESSANISIQIEGGNLEKERCTIYNDIVSTFNNSLR